MNTTTHIKAQSKRSLLMLKILRTLTVVKRVMINTQKFKVDDHVRILK